MKIQNIAGYYNTDRMSNTVMTKPNYNCSFKADLWEDDNYDPGSIFYIWKRDEKAHEIVPSDFTEFRTSVGYPVTTEPLKSAKINLLRFIGNNTYKGGMTDAAGYVEELQDIGIEKIIVLCDPKECNIEQACKKNNMAWTNIFVPLSMNPVYGEKEFDNNFNWNKFINIVHDLRKGQVFIGCESGNIRTERFLHTVKILDPEFKLDLGRSDSESYDYVLANWIYKGLSSEQKHALNYTKEFEEKLIKNLELHMPMKFRHI